MIGAVALSSLIVLYGAAMWWAVSASDRDMESLRRRHTHPQEEPAPGAGVERENHPEVAPAGALPRPPSTLVGAAVPRHAAPAGLHRTRVILHG